MGWHGLDGDRRFAFRRRAERGGFPWLTASRLPELILYRPCDGEGADSDAAPTHVGTPDGRVLSILARATVGTLETESGRPLDLRSGDAVSREAEPPLR